MVARPASARPAGVCARPAGFFTARRSGASFFTALSWAGRTSSLPAGAGRASSYLNLGLRARSTRSDRRLNLLLITYYLLLITWGGADFFTARRGGRPYLLQSQVQLESKIKASPLP